MKIGHDKGIVQHGHVWSTRPEPTLSDENTKLGTSLATGPFTSSLTTLQPNVTYHVRAYATNALGTSYGEDVTFTTKVGIVSLTTTVATDIIHNAATVGGSISDFGGNSVVERGVCWGTFANPSLNDNHAVSSDATDRFTVRIEGLSEKTAYHIRAYVKTAQGDAFYGNDQTFTTTHEIHLPQADVTEVGNVGVTFATFRSAVTSDGDGNISDCGFCYSRVPNPTVNDNKVSCGKSMGSFSKKVTGLTDNTTYYVRAYVTNEAGTAYGEEVNFATLEITVPTVSAVSVKNFTHKSASFAANLLSNGNGTVSECGFVYSVNPSPELTNHKIVCGTSTEFSGRTTSLLPSTTYYVRAYATNEKGTAFSEDLCFTTNEEPEGSSIEVDEGYETENEWDKTKE